MGIITKNAISREKNKIPLLVKITIPFVVIAIIICAVLILPSPKQSTPAESYEISSLNGDSSKIDALPLTGKVYSQTIMIYMVGSDLESSSGMASLDIDEILGAEVDTNKNNILIFTGGTKQWQGYNIPVDKNILFRVGNGALEPVASMEQSNMGDAETLYSFINYGMKNYSTDLYSLILWDHGGGPVIGYGFDEIYNDCLDISELSSAVSKGLENTGKQLEWIGFDACLMGSVEVANALKGYTKYMIASQETEPGYGWNYNFLEQLSKPDMDGARLSKAIIDDYFSFYNTLFSTNPNQKTDLTLSCVDLSAIDTLIQSIDELFKNVDTGVLDGSFAEIVRYRENTKSFGRYSTNYEYDLVDLGHMIKMLNDKYTSDTVSTNIVNMMMYRRTNTVNTNGISIYYPYRNVTDSEKMLQSYSGIGFSVNYTKFINNFYNAQKNPTATADKSLVSAKTNSNIKDAGREFTLELSDEQAANFSSATYYILEKKKDADDEYVFIFSSRDVKKDGKILSASFSNKAIYAVDGVTGEVSSKPLQIIEKEVASENEKKYVGNIVLSRFGNIDDMAVDNAKIQISVNTQTKKGEILNAVLYSESTSNMADKELADIYDYDYMSFIGGVNRLTRDDDGNMLPYFSWEQTNRGEGVELTIAHNNKIEMREIDNPEDFVCMFVVNDIYANQYASELIPLK